MPNNLFCSPSKNILCREDKILAFRFSARLHFELRAEHKKEMFLQEPRWSRLFSAGTHGSADYRTFSLQRSISSRISLLWSPSCVCYLYKASLCSSHQIARSVYVWLRSIPTGWISVGFISYSGATAFDVSVLCGINSIFKGTGVPHLPLLSLDVPMLKSWNMPWSQILQLYPDTPC